MKVKVATPISTIFDSTALVSEILEVSDALELRDHSREVASALPRLYHCEASLLEPWPPGEAARIAGIVKKNQVKLLTLHLHSCYIRPPIADGMFQPQGKMMSREEMFENARRNKKHLEEQLGASIPMAVENTNYYPTGAYEIVTDGEFIGFLADQLGLKLLLDLAHVQISAINQNISAAHYLGKFDLSKVTQVHLSRPRQESSVCRDAHEALQEEDWQMAAQIMRRCPNLQYAAVEYYKDDKKLIAMLWRLKKELLK